MRAWRSRERTASTAASGITSRQTAGPTEIAANGRQQADRGEGAVEARRPGAISRRLSRGEVPSISPARSEVAAKSKANWAPRATT